MYRVEVTDLLGEPVVDFQWLDSLEWALKDRDAMRRTFWKSTAAGFSIVVRDTTGRLMEWDDLMASVTAGA